MDITALLVARAVLTLATAALLVAPPALWASGFNNRHVLVLGVDGCRSDALLAANAPNLKALAAEGMVAYSAYAGGVLGTPAQQPTVSAPGWASILTGVWTDKHKVTENTFWGYDHTNHPHFFRRLKQFNPQASLASIVEWAAVDTYLVAPVSADVEFRQIAIDNTTTNLVSRASAILESANPDVIVLHFHEVDTAGHSAGFSPTSPAYLAAIARVDAGIGTLLEAVRRRPAYTNESWLILAATDHGGTGTGHGGQTSAERTTWVIAHSPDCPPRLVAPGPGQTCVASTVLAFLGVPIPAAWGWVSAPFGVPLTNGLAVHLTLDNTLAGQGGTAHDGAVYGWPPGATPRFIPGFLGQAARFENTGDTGLPDDWVLTLGNIDNVYRDDFSVSLWLRRTGSMNAAVFANRSLANAGDAGWSVGSADDSTVSWTAAGSVPRSVSLHPPVLDGAWHLVTATFNRGANEVVTYLDGRPHSITNLGASGLAPVASGRPTLVGAGADGTYAAWADVDDLGVWRRTLAPAEVAELYDKAQQGKALLDRYTPPPVIMSQPLSQSAFPGGSVRFQVSAYGSDLSYQWTQNGHPLPEATNDTLLLSPVQPTHDGRYAVAVSNPTGGVISADATLSVLVPPPGATSLAIDLVAYYPFEAHTAGVVTNAVRTAGYPGFDQDQATLDGAEEAASSLRPPHTTNSANVRAGTGALDCDGVGDYGQIPGNPVATGLAWSVAAWFKPETGGAGYTGSTRAFVFETGGGSYPISFGLRAGADGFSNFQLYTDYASGTDPSRDGAVANADVDQWHHIAVVHRPANARLEGLLDGKLTYQIPLAAPPNPNYAGFHFGTYRKADDRWFKGQIDEAALWQRALAPSEITDLFAAGVQGLTLADRISQPGGAAFSTDLTAYYGFDNPADWRVANDAPAVGGTGFPNDTLTLKGGSIDPGQRRYPLTQDPQLARVGQGALIGDGTNNYAHIQGQPVDPNRNWSVAAWFKPDTGGLGLSTDARAFVFETAGTTYPISFGLRAGSSGNTDFQLYTHTVGSSPSQSHYLPAAQVDQWHHILITYKDATGALIGYLDGRQTHSIGLGPDALLQSYAGFNLGTYRAADGRWFKGLIDEVAFWQRNLDPNEAALLYALGQAGASILTGAPELLSFSPNLEGDGGYWLRWRAVPGFRYTIEASTDLLNWSIASATDCLATDQTASVLISPVSPTPPNALYDPGIASAGARFYRVRSQP